MRSLPSLAKSPRQVRSAPQSKAKTGHKKGEAHWACVFSRHEIELMRDLAAEGWTQAQIREKFEISRAHLSRVLRYLNRAE